MNAIWGLLMAAIGLFMLICGTLKSKFILYELLVARARIAWGEGNAVHYFFQLSGIILVVLGGLWAAGIIWK